MRLRPVGSALVLAGVLTLALLLPSATRAEAVWPNHLQASAGADLQVLMVDAPDPARYVQTWASYTYTITVTNAGPDPAVGVKANFTILNPGSTGGDIYGRPNPFVQAINALHGQSVNTSQGTCQVGGASVRTFYLLTEVNCDLGSLATGSVATIAVKVQAGRYPPLSPNASETVTNTASVSSETDDPVPSNNTAAENTTIVQGYADLSVSMTPAPDPVVPGLDRTFTIILRNDGPDVATAFLDFAYPGSGRLDDRVTSVVAEKGICLDSAPSDVYCRVNLAPGEDATITVDVTPGQQGVRSYTAILGTGCSAGALCTFASFMVNPTPDPDLSDNSATVSEEAVQTDVSVVKSSSLADVYVGQSVDYTMTVTNHGPSGA